MILIGPWVNNTSKLVNANKLANTTSLATKIPGTTFLKYVSSEATLLTVQDENELVRSTGYASPKPFASIVSGSRLVITDVESPLVAQRRFGATSGGTQASVKQVAHYDRAGFSFAPCEK